MPKATSFELGVYVILSKWMNNEDYVHADRLKAVHLETKKT